MAKSTVGMPKDNLMGFTVFKPENKPVTKLTRREIFFTLSGSGTRFSMKAIETMKKPEAVIVLFDASNRMLVVPSKLSDSNAMYLAQPGAGDTVYKSLLKMRSLNNEILCRMNLGKIEDFKGLIRCFGKKIERVDDTALLFDLAEIRWERK